MLRCSCGVVNDERAGSVTPLGRSSSRIAIDGLLTKLLPEGHEDVSWWAVAPIRAIARFCEPSSELHIEEKWCRRTAPEDPWGVPPEKVHTDRLYAALNRLLPHKEAIESHLKHRFGDAPRTLLYECARMNSRSKAATSSCRRSLQAAFAPRCDCGT